jgi:hypothetical protein
MLLESLGRLRLQTLRFYLFLSDLTHLVLQINEFFENALFAVELYF